MEAGMTAHQRTFKTEYRQYCAHAGGQVTIETLFVAPAEHLPETPPRIASRTCSHYCDCRLQDKAACTFSVHAPQVFSLQSQFV
jgi:hypothetical protein